MVGGCSWFDDNHILCSNNLNVFVEEIRLLRQPYLFCFVVFCLERQLLGEGRAPQLVVRSLHVPDLHLDNVLQRLRKKSFTWTMSLSPARATWTEEKRNEAKTWENIKFDRNDEKPKERRSIVVGITFKVTYYSQARPTFTFIACKLDPYMMSRISTFSGALYNKQGKPGKKWASLTFDTPSKWNFFWSENFKKWNTEPRTSTQPNSG